MKDRYFGKTRTGSEATLYTLHNQQGMEISLTDYGARLVSVQVADKNGRRKDVVLGYKGVEDYETDPYCFGATIGRNANRLENAQFILNDVKYQLAQNEYENNCHSGPDGYQDRMWEVRKKPENGIQFGIVSPHLDQGFPGELDVTVTYTLTEENEIIIRYLGICSVDTVVNMTHHSYFNLNGHDSGDILGQYLRIYAREYTPVFDEKYIPTGEHATVYGTLMDFTKWKKMGDYNHNFILDKKLNEIDIMAEAYCEESGIFMRAWTDLPAMQLYTGVYLGNVMGKENFLYRSRNGFCLEAQFTPNAINQKSEVQPILFANEPYDFTVIYQFTNKKMLV